MTRRTVVTLARSGVAVGVPAGRSKPDISSVDALKRRLLAAKSIAYPDGNLGHARGIPFRWVMDRLAITNEVDAKAKLMKGTVVELAERFTWAAGIAATATSAEAGRALIQFLSSPAAAAIIKKRGMEPAAR
ncbi:MAG: hypothetical protein HY294_08755 [Candidatus Rokubacteria bacterium]|nr:hypothetical protein [Candidatus Rokubacteria bacterium]